MPRSEIKSPATHLWSAYTYDEFKALRPDKLIGSVAADPKHVNAPQGEFRLQGDSPAVNTGVAHSYYEVFFARYGVRIKGLPMKIQVRGSRKEGRK